MGYKSQGPKALRPQGLEAESKVYGLVSKVYGFMVLRCGFVALSFGFLAF